MSATRNGGTPTHGRRRISFSLLAGRNRPSRGGAQQGDSTVDRAVAVSPWMILNETNRYVQIRACDGGELWLTPLGTRQFTDDVVERFRLDCWTETLTAETSANKRTKQADGDRKRAHRLYRVLRGSGGQQLYLAGSILLGAVLPAALIYFAADGGRLLHLLTSTSARQAAAQSAPITEHDVMVTLLGRGLQIAFVMVAALLPALLYLLFDHEHLDTLRQRFTRQIMRFDPALRTRKDVVAKYGNLMNEAYGRDSTGKILPGRRSPLLLATFTVTLGWSFTLLHGDVFIVRERGIAALFEPRQTAVSFGFIGAYFYGLNAILRGYVRRDLRPKTYTALTARIFIVVILVWVLELVLNTQQNNALYVVAFLSGIVPETALVLIKESVRATAGKKPSGYRRRPGSTDQPRRDRPLRSGSPVR